MSILNAAEVLDYSGNTPFLDAELSGTHIVDVLAFEHAPDAANGAAYFVEIEIVESTHARARVGSRHKLYFKDPEFVARAKGQLRMAATLRSFLAACWGSETSDPTFDADVVNDKLKSLELKAGDVRIRIDRSTRPGKGEHVGKIFSNDVFSAVA
jgi:hypothetical protein